mmetsp:Transcript_924/g.2540  ORF Transcript_924/g.2540 Transcript_924/m.2540 type:complete len:207 (-) Transcript_924:686-1306(-)
MLGSHILQYHVLIRAHHQVNIELVHNRAKRLLHLIRALVLDTPVFHKETKKQLAVALLVPTEPVFVLPLRKTLESQDLRPVVRLDELAKLVDSELIYKILHARVRAVLAIAVVALCGNNCLDELENFGLLHVSEMITDARKRAFLVVRAAHAAADNDVEANQLARALRNSHEPNVLRVDVDRVITRYRDADFELSRKVGLAVDRFL